jgi:hypothetical protein
MERRRNKSAGSSGLADGAWSRGAAAPAAATAPVAPTKVAPGGWRAKEEERKRLEALGQSPASAAPLSPAAPSPASPAAAAAAPASSQRPTFKLAPRSTPAPMPTSTVPASVAAINGTNSTSTSSESTTTPNGAPLRKQEPEKDGDGFQAVPERGAKFVRGQGKWSRGGAGGGRA